MANQTEVSQAYNEVWQHAAKARQNFWQRDGINVLEALKMDERLVHYTSISAALNIVQTKQFWVSSTSRLRDISELNYGHYIRSLVFNGDDSKDLRKNNIFNICVARANENMSSNESTSFILSFSTEEPNTPDSLLHWNDFGDNKRGAAIVFKQDFLGRATNSAIMSTNLCAIGKVEYDLEKQKIKWLDLFRFIHDNVAELENKYPHEIIADVYSVVSTTLFSMINPFFKHPMLRKEREARALITVFENNYGSIHFREFGSQTIPYYPIWFDGVGAAQSEIEAIYLGPSYDEGLRLKLLGILKRDALCRGVKVEFSGFPRHR